MKKAFKKYTTNFVLLVLALQILNMSNSCRIADDSFFSQIDDSINIADHAVEFIVEDLMGYTNAFPEVKENKQQHPVSYSQKMQGLTLFSFKPKIEVSHCLVLIAVNYSPLVVYPYCGYLWEITPPPPKLV